MVMDPADTTRTFAWSSRPDKVCTSEDTCQARLNGHGQYLGAICLLNFKSSRGERLAIFLRSVGYKVYVPVEHGGTAHDLADDELRLAGLVMFDVNSTSAHVLAELRRVYRVRKDGKPFVIAWLTTPCDVEFQLKVEDLADRVVEYAPE
jgi:hypothetical protein